MLLQEAQKKKTIYLHNFGSEVYVQQVFELALCFPYGKTDKG